MHLQTATQNKLIHFLQNMPSISVLVVGDAGLDEYITGDVKRISPEAPVPVLEVQSRSYRVGLAGNVAQNITSLGASAEFVAVLGEDSAGDSLKGLLQEAKVSLKGLSVETGRPTVVKTRAMTGQYQLLRIDHELKKYISPQTEAKILSNCLGLLPQVQAVVVEDYAKGLLTQSLFQNLAKECRKAGKPLLVDPARSNPASFYRGCTLFKPNFDEALQLAGMPREELREDPLQLQQVAARLFEQTQAEHLVITRGKLGMSVFSAQGPEQHIPTFAQAVFDVTGAGDTAIAALAVGLTGGLALSDACVLANLAAGYVVGQVGSVPCPREELLHFLRSTPTSTS